LEIGISTASRERLRFETKLAAGDTLLAASKIFKARAPLTSSF
jgi:hypothetical protein